MENLSSLSSLDQIEADDVNSRLAAIVDSSNDAIISKNLKGVISTWNRAAERLLGYSESEAVGKPITILIPSELLEEETDIIKRVRAGERIEHYETRRVSREGRTLDVSITVSPIRNKQGTIIGASKILRDITEAKRVQVALRESERRLAHEVAGARALHSISTRLISEMTEESLFSQILDAAMELMCSDAASIQMLSEDGTSLALLGWKHFHPSSAVFWERVTAEAGSTCGVALRDSVRVLVSDVEDCEFMAGTEDLEEYRRSGIRAVQSTPLQSRAGRPVGMISTHWHAAHSPTEDDFRLFDVLARQAADLIERVRAENAIRESEERFRLITNTVPVAIWTSDTSKGWVFINQTALEFTGQSIDASLGNRWMTRIHQEDAEQFWEIYSQAFDRRERFQVEFRLRRCDCEYRWVVCTGAPRYNADGSFAGYIGSSLDITERKEAERAIREANDELNRLKNQLEAENIYLQDELQQEQTFGELVGQGEVMKSLSHKINQVAPTDATVLILGETGTGKELVARAIHEASKRRGRTLIKVNCAALAPSLIESELFGHEKGAFTGASSRKVGRFELANGGSIFLDEIGELPPDLQVKLLRVLQENEFERVGGGKTIKVDVRVIAATNRNLREEVNKGRFREDLWYRLNVFPISTPPLRNRLDDIPVLVEHFVNRLNRKFGRQITSVSSISMRALFEYSWPGNVRELGNLIERAVINSNGPVLRIHNDFQSTDVSALALNLKTLEEVERDYILRVLEELYWRIEGPHGAARILGINPSTLRGRMVKLGIHRLGTRFSTSPNGDE